MRLEGRGAMRIAVAVEEGIEGWRARVGWLATCAATDFHTFQVFPRHIDFWVPDN